MFIYTKQYYLKKSSGGGNIWVQKPSLKTTNPVTPEFVLERRQCLHHHVTESLVAVGNLWSYSTHHIS